MPRLASAILYRYRIGIDCLQLFQLPRVPGLQGTLGKRLQSSNRRTLCQLVWTKYRFQLSLLLTLILSENWNHEDHCEENWFSVRNCLHTFQLSFQGQFCRSKRDLVELTEEEGTSSTRSLLLNRFNSSMGVWLMSMICCRPTKRQAKTSGGWWGNTFRFWKKMFMLIDQGSAFLLQSPNQGVHRVAEGQKEAMKIQEMAKSRQRG